MKSLGRRRKNVDFNPNHEFVANAVEEFLKDGGKIEKIEMSDDKFSKFSETDDGLKEVNEFLIDK
jgi:hypothetical protein